MRWRWVDTLAGTECECGRGGTGRERDEGSCTLRVLTSRYAMHACRLRLLLLTSFNHSACTTGDQFQIDIIILLIAIRCVVTEIRFEQKIIIIGGDQCCRRKHACKENRMLIRVGGQY